MNLIVLILMLFLFGLSAAIYLAGILVIDHVNLSVQLDHKVQQYYNWVVQYGSQEQRQAAVVAVQNRDLENLQALVGMDLATN